MLEAHHIAAARGCGKRLPESSRIAFTHFDLVRRQANLPTFEPQRAHVLSPVHQKLISLRNVVGQPAVRAIERDLQERCFMLGFLDRPLTEKNRGPIAELSRLLDFCEAAIKPEALPETHPVYDTATLILAIQAATADFHERWDAILGFKRSANIRTAHWAEVKALNRRIVLKIETGEYKDLKPVADLVARLAESVTDSSTTRSAGSPGCQPKPKQRRPSPACSAPSSNGSTSSSKESCYGYHAPTGRRPLSTRPRIDLDRRRVIHAIYDSSAPIPDPVLDVRSEQFLRELRVLLHEAVAEGGGELVSDVLGQRGV